jgi:hypothetical protein
MHRFRRSLLTVLAVGAVLAVPATSQADDAAMKAGVVPALQALAKKELGASSALRRVQSRGRGAVAHARMQVRAARRSARVFATLLGAQQPSTPAGEQAKALLLRGLDLEATAYSRADIALKSYKAGNTARANRILRRADRAILRAVNDGKKAIEIMATL